MTLAENKIALIEAHRAGDWELAKVLSQERQALKPKSKPRCRVCQRRITVRKAGWIVEFCAMHDPRRLAMRPWLKYPKL